MSKTIKGTKEQIKSVNDFLIDVTLSGRPVKIQNELQHKAALQLVKAGMAIITKKKNYGRIDEIKGCEVMS